MSTFREYLKRTLPVPVRDWIIATRARFDAPPIEDIVLHDFVVRLDTNPKPRLTLFIPTLLPAMTFGGVTTGLDIYLDIAKRVGADMRVIVEDFGGAADLSILYGRAAKRGIEPAQIEVVARKAQTPTIDVRRQEQFVSFNWWNTLNIAPLIKAQAEGFNASPVPFIYLIQEYEPHFYQFSSTHMLAYQAFSPTLPCWGIFNSSQLHTYFERQGHRLEKAFVFEPRLSDALRPALTAGRPTKEKIILVYGRPTVERNCFPAVEKGLRLWAAHDPRAKEWSVVSAGLPHPPLALAPGLALTSLGKLSLQDYGDLLRKTAVGLSLMASPHPSYPPLEMAHFGVRTVTNRYIDKNLATAHDNIVSITDISAESVAEGLSLACDAFLAAPNAGWDAHSHMPGYLSTQPDPFLDQVAAAITAQWAGPAPAETKPKRAKVAAR